jgi:hypothetical protein
MMLHAVEKRKTKYFERYAGIRDGREKRVCEEDEIVSTIFGPLEFVDAASVFNFWTDVIQLERESTEFPVTLPVRCQFALWPRNNKVEPDAHFTFLWADNKRFDVLVEFKWRARLVPEDELHRQWQNYLTDDVRGNCWHVFIARDISAGLVAKGLEEVNGIKIGKVWQIGNDDRLILISWAQIRDTLTRYRNRSDGLARWAVLIGHFLEEIGIVRFKGFADASRALPKGSVLHRSFYRGSTHGFNGFGSAMTKLPVSANLFQSFFKESCNG